MIRTLIALVLLCPSMLFAQSFGGKEQGFLFTPHVALQFPKADLQKRYNNFASIGLSALFKTKKNMLFGLEYDWYFGDGVNEIGTFSEITSDFGQIIDSDGNYSVVRLNIKGNYVTGNIGYLINLPSDEKNSGILVQLGAGIMQHKIDIVSSQLKIPQINGEYEKGYDKLAYGLATKQYVGYQYLTLKNRYHLRAGVEFNQGFTKGRRSWDFNANAPGTNERFDMTVALKLGIVVPVYTKQAEDEEFFFD